MWEYRYTDELYHYGVLGMKWGVRRASKRLALDRNDQKAISSLNKHRQKSADKIQKLKRQNEKLEKQKTKSGVEAAKYHYEATRAKAGGLIFGPNDRKANRLERKAARKYVSRTKAEERIRKNDKLQEVFSKGINDIDQILIDRGKQYVDSAK